MARSFLNTVFGRKAKKTRRHSKAAAKGKKGRKPANITVEKPADIKALVDLIEKNKIVLVFIGAEWCGHCKTFKPLWDELADEEGRKLPMAHVDETVLADTPLAGANIKGFPSVTMIGNDKKLATFPDGSNAMPNMRNMDHMKALVKKDPNAVMSENGLNDEPALSATPIPRVEAAQNRAANDIIASINAGKGIPTSFTPAPVATQPPNMNDDVVVAKPPAIGGARGGGSLYASLLQMAKGVAAPAATRKGRRGNKATSKKLSHRRR
jgi:thiol-disulfide isomerase/thioredoxin